MDRYQRVKLLGRGSYGSAILVRERKGGVQPLRVIKEIDLSRMPASAQREAESEASVLRSLSHPYIVAYFETFREATRLYIVMEFADNGDLSGAVKQRKADGANFSEAEALKILVQCSLALQHVHNKHILHRDLKSQNIFLTKAGDCKLGDFGIAKVLDHTQAEAVTLIGTPIYLAPEVCDSRPYGIKADIWSLGIVLYELFALAPPFRAENLAALMMRILRADPDPLSTTLYSEEVRSLVNWMLEKAPEKRPTIDEVLAVQSVQKCAARLPAKAETKTGSGTGIAAAGAAGSAGSRESSFGRRPRSGASDRGEKAQSAASSARAPLLQAGPQLPGGADALDDFVASWKKPEQLRAAVGGRPAAALQPVGGARQRAPSAGDAAAEFRRNRELAAMAKARAEGDLHSRPRCNSLDPAMGMAVAADAAPSGSGQGRRTPMEARRAAEEQHLQALQEAAAQARRDRRQVQQRMQDLERPPEQEDAVAGIGPQRFMGSGSARGDPAATRLARGDGAAPCRRSSEDQHRLELQEAAAQARRDRLLIKQKMAELERVGPGEDATQRASHHDVAEAGGAAADSPQLGAAARKAAEEQHVQALQEAAAQARRDRKLIKQKMDDLANPKDDSARRDGELDSARGDSVERSPGRRAAARQAAEEQRMQALQEAAAQSRRDRKQIHQKMLDLDRVSSDDIQPSVCEDAAAASRDHASAHRAGSGRLGCGSGAAGSWAYSPSRAEKEKAEALHVQALQEAAAQARRDRKLLQQKMQEAEAEAVAMIATASGLGGSSAPSASPPRMSPTPPAAAASMSQRQSLAELLAAGEQPAEGLVRSSPPLASPPRVSPTPPAAASMSQRQSLAEMLAAGEQPAEVRSRSAEVRLDSTHRRPLGRSSSLSLAGNLLASSAGFGRPRPCTTDGPTSAPSRGSPEPPLSPQFGSRSASLDDANASLGLAAAAADSAVAASMASAAAASELRNVTPVATSAGSRARSRSIGMEGGISQSDQCSSTLRLSDGSEMSAEDLLAMKLSNRRSSPPPPRLMRGSGTSECSAGDLQALSQVAKNSSGNLTFESLGSLSYTGTGTISSRFSTVSCITAQ